MTRYSYLFIVWLLAAYCAISRADEIKAPGYGGSVYVPICLERRCKEPKRNSIFMLTGPPPTGIPGTRGLMGLGYFRQLKDELEVGAVGIATDREFIGWMIGVGVRF